LEKLVNSAFNGLNNDASDSLASFHAFSAESDSCYGIYNSTGKLLKGNKIFERYTELAIQLDTKRSAFYLESNENEVIFGCSLSVKVDNGREERVVFIQASKNALLPNENFFGIQLLNAFYEMAHSSVEGLESNNYKFVGIWNEGDFRNISEVPIEKDFLDYTMGKISFDEKVFVRISGLNNGLSLILMLIPRFRNKPSFIFDVSQFPSESNLSISLIKPDPDFEIRENGTCKQLIQSELWNFYTELGKEILKNENIYSKKIYGQPEALKLILKKIHEQIYDYNSSDVIFSNLGDRQKVVIFLSLVSEIDSADVKKALLNVYGKIKAPECRIDLHRSLLERNIFIEELVKDLVTTIYKDHNKELFNFLFNVSPSEDSFFKKRSTGEFIERKSKRALKYRPFEKGIKAFLADLNYLEKVNFLKYLLSESPSNPQTAGKILLENLITDLVKSKRDDFIFQISEEEAERLDEILDANCLDTRKRLKREKRNRKIKRNFIALATVVTLLLIISGCNYYKNSLTVVGNFTTNVTNGSAPLTVQFSDNSELQGTAFPNFKELLNKENLKNAISWIWNPKKLLEWESWYWNFGDGITSKEQNPSHTYYEAGNYTATLKVSINNETNLTTTTINVFFWHRLTNLMHNFEYHV
jgi:hypothetical protein